MMMFTRTHLFRISLYASQYLFITQKSQIDLSNQNL
jgi:hypothetical protein